MHVEALPVVTMRVPHDGGALVEALFREHGRELVRLARFFVDDRNAAEDLVQEAFIRFARSLHRVRDHAKAVAYLRAVVLNLARDHNRRGLVSVRHLLAAASENVRYADDLELRADQQEVLDALRDLPRRQRDCLVLRYYADLPIAGVADTLGLSENSVKTHIRRGMAALEGRLGVHQ